MDDIKPMLERIKEIKKFKGHTNESLALSANIPKSTLSKLLAGIIKEPPVSSIIRIAKALEVSADYLISGDVTLSESDKAKTIFNKYNQLNDFGKKKADEYISDLLTMDKYRADISLEDDEDYDDAETASYMAAYSGGINHKGKKLDIDDIKELNSMAENEDE